MQVCPIVLQKQNHEKPARFLPIGVGGSVSKALRGQHIDECVTVGEIIDQFGAKDNYGLNRSRLVAWKNTPDNFNCGGDVVLFFGVVNESIERGEYNQCTSICVSKQKDGSFEIAIPI